MKDVAYSLSVQKKTLYGDFEIADSRNYWFVLSALK